MSLFAAVHESGCGTFGTHGADGHGSAMRSTAEVDQPMFKGPSLMLRPAAVLVQFHNAAKVSKSNFPRERKFGRHFKGNARQLQASATWLSVFRLRILSLSRRKCRKSPAGCRIIPVFGRPHGDWFRSPLATCFKLFVPKRSIGRASKTPCPKCFVRAGDRIQQRLCHIDFVRTTGASHSGKTRRRGGRLPI
jgi:hypothetical protein